MEQSGLFNAERDLESLARQIVPVQVNADAGPAAFAGVRETAGSPSALSDGEVAVGNADRDPWNMPAGHRPFLLVFDGDSTVRVGAKPYPVVVDPVGARVA